MNKNQLDLSKITEHILLVDDDPTILTLLTRTLAHFGMNATDQAANGVEAVEHLLHRKYGLIITDIMMPEMDGMGLLLYTQEHFPEVDVLAISGHNELYNFTDLVAAGATDFISKPFQRDELKAKLQRIFRERLLLAELAARSDKEKAFFLNIVESLAISLDEKDQYTHGHSRRVTNFSLQLAEHATEEIVDFELLRLSGILHDIGKIGIPDSILGKEGKLTDEEFTVIKQHPELGAQILQPMDSDKRVSTISKVIKHHHERYDGKGYPDGLKGKEIPHLSRIIAVADAYDAMTSDRSYRKEIASSLAIEEIRKNSGTQFDPILAEKFIIFMEQCSTSSPCPALSTCSIFPKISKNVISNAFEMQYCRTNFNACARYKITDKTLRPKNLLPDGSLITRDT